MGRWLGSLAFSLLLAGCGSASEVDAAGATDDGSSSGSTSGSAGAGMSGTSSSASAPSGEDTSASSGGSEPEPACDAPAVCARDQETITCPHQTQVYRTGATALTEREVHWQTPACEAPASGWPAVIMFQGSAFTSELNWVGLRDAPLGMWEQAALLSDLLDAGFVVITPEAHIEGSTFWDTNIPPFSLAWETSADHRLMQEIFAGIANGDFGAVDPSRLFATGISSGGYMTSRMAVSYPGRFEALAIQSASYATCGGPACLIPDELPADHPPTLFLHGSADLIVPIETMTPYSDELQGQGTSVRVVVDPDAGHEWIDAAPDEVVRWFVDAL